ncbi:UxaA family hydrolase [Spirosoma endbachense]|nr:UxaA family hydrolase [Spirosoma endbachense]
MKSTPPCLRLNCGGPSTGNIKDGLITDAIKSAEAAKKEDQPPLPTY